MSRRNSTTSTNHGDDLIDDEVSETDDLPNENKKYCKILFHKLRSVATDEIHCNTNLKDIINEELRELNALKENYDKKSIEAELDGNVNFNSKLWPIYQKLELFLIRHSSLLELIIWVP